MTTEQQIELARRTYELLAPELGPNLAGIIKHPVEDPQILRKGKHDLVNLRILPVKAAMKPAGFWHRTGCYYEILVGPCDGPLCLGSVQFFRYANQVKCGGPKFTPAVQGILQHAQKAAPIGFSLTLPEIDGQFHFQRHFQAKDFKGLLFPCDQAARDSSWLIKSTLLRFQAMLPA